MKPEADCRVLCVGGPRMTYGEGRAPPCDYEALFKRSNNALRDGMLTRLSSLHRHPSRLVLARVMKEDIFFPWRYSYSRLCGLYP